MDGEGDVKMESMPSASNGNGDVKPPVKTSVMVMPTGPAPMISNKHPVMHLNELTQESKFELVSEDKETGPSNKKRRVYTMMLMCKNEKFQGIGQSKKIAKEEAAKYALLKLFNILYIPGMSFNNCIKG